MEVVNRGIVLRCDFLKGLQELAAGIVDQDIDFSFARFLSSRDIACEGRNCFFDDGLRRFKQAQVCSNADGCRAVFQLLDPGDDIICDSFAARGSKCDGNLKLS